MTDDHTDLWQSAFRIELLVYLDSHLHERVRPSLAAIWAAPDVTGPFDTDGHRVDAGTLDAARFDALLVGTARLPGARGEAVFSTKSLFTSNASFLYAGFRKSELIERYAPSPTLPSQDDVRWIVEPSAWLFALALHIYQHAPWQGAAITSIGASDLGILEEGRMCDPEPWPFATYLFPREGGMELVTSGEHPVQWQRQWIHP